MTTLNAPRIDACDGLREAADRMSEPSTPTASRSDVLYLIQATLRRLDRAAPAHGALAGHAERLCPRGGIVPFVEFEPTPGDPLSDALAALRDDDLSDAASELREIVETRERRGIPASVLDDEQVATVRELFFDELRETASALADQAHEAMETGGWAIGADAHSTFQRAQRIGALLDLIGWDTAADYALALAGRAERGA